MTVARISQAVVETVSTVSPKTRLSQAVVETISQVTPKARLSQTVLETISSNAISATTLTGYSNGTNQNTANYSLTLPSAAANGDLIVGAVSFTASGTIAFPAGWTLLHSTSTFAIGYRVKQSGDPSSITITNTASGYATGTSLSYSGVDTANPIDTFAVQTSAGEATSTAYRAPAVAHNYNGSRTLTMFAQHGTSSGSSAPTNGPKDQTPIFTNLSGPSVIGYDVVDPSGSEAAATWTSRTTPRTGVTIALKANGASSVSNPGRYPYVAGTQLRTSGGSSATTVTGDLLEMGVRDGDLVVAAIGSNKTITPPSGYTALQTVAGVGVVYTHTWRTGDATSLTFTQSSGGYAELGLTLVRKNHSAASDPTVDASGVASATTTATTPTITPTDANGLLLAIFNTGTSSGGSWTSLPSGLTTIYSTGFGPMMAILAKQPSTTTPGTHSASSSVATTVMATVLSIKTALASTKRKQAKPMAWQKGSVRGSSYVR